MAQRIAVWYGTDGELAELRQAVARNCVCADDGSYVCQPHLMLSDQATLNHLTFVRTTRMTYLRAEHDLTGEWF
jgi:hypothetical protein